MVPLKRQFNKIYLKGELVMTGKVKGMRKTVDVMVRVGGDKPKLYVNHGEKIRVVESENPLKVIVAREISNWLNAPGRYWGFSGSIDKNAQRIFDYLTDKFSDYTWTINHSQGTFDIVSLDAKVVIEVKSTKSGSKQLVTNASIYPDKIRAITVLNKGFKWGKFSPDTVLDVLVVCVERSKKDILYNYAIVDGSYWGFTEEDYKACKLLFTQLNDSGFKKRLAKFILNEYENIFLEKLTKGVYGSGVTMDFRKLISVSNPIGRLTTSGWWHIG
jgi:hypothetical protein